MIDLVDVPLRGGPHDGRVVKAPLDYTVIMMPGETEARWMEKDDEPDEMTPAIYVRTNPWRKRP